MSIEVVERKGIGHPDTIADALANELSRRYTLYCIEHFGGALRHSVDKLVVAGGVSKLAFGEGEFISPMHCDVVGKMTVKYQGMTIPTAELLGESISAVLERAMPLLDLSGIMRPRIQLLTNNGIGAEHSLQYYAPLVQSHLDTIELKCEANDTAVTFCHSVFTPVEFLTWKIENVLTCVATRERYGVGTDVKVLVRRQGSEIFVHVAVPFIASLVSSEADYRDKLASLRQEILQLVSEIAPQYNLVSLAMNTKDRRGFGYLTLAGSSLDKGDQGAVGRGNGYNGLISMMRPQSNESHSGKNPLRSPGRIFPFICRLISERYAAENGHDITVGIQSANGLPLSEPAAIFGVKSDGEFMLLNADILHDDIVAARRSALDAGSLAADLNGRVE